MTSGALIDLAVGCIPLASGLITAAIVGGVRGSAGEALAARPPPVVFSIVWPLLYVAIGISWVLSADADRPSRLATDVIYSAVAALLCVWIVVYSANTPEARIRGVWVMVASIAAVQAAWSVAARRSTWAACLLSPLSAWLLFALMLSFAEVQDDARPQARGAPRG